APQRVALVLVAVAAAADDPAARRVVLPDAGVVARGDEVAAEGVGALEEGGPLDVGVAEDARVGRAPFEIVGGEPLDDAVAKLLADVDDEVGEAEADGHGAGVVHGLERAAAHLLAAAGLRLGRTAGRRVVPRLHRHADDVVALLVEEGGGDGGVHPAAHGDEDAAVAAHAIG